MIKTLQITAIATAIFACVIVFFAAGFGIHKDANIEKLLASPGAVEEFIKAKGDRAKNEENQVAPLVKLADTFSLYLNPPPPVEPPPGQPGAPEPPKPPKISVKFDVLGTSYFASNPALSLALIDEPGTGSRWVRQSSKVGHLVIEQVRDGCVIVRDGDKTIELTAPREERISLLKGSLSKGSSLSQIAALSPVGVGTDVNVKTAAAKTKTLKKKGTKPGKSVEEKKAMMQQFVNSLKSMDSTHSSDKKTIEQLEKLMSNFEGANVGPEEANNLGNLGQDLQKKGQQPQNRDKYRTERAKSLHKSNAPQNN